MSHFFCAESSRQAGIDIIGSAPPHEIYVLVECPTPWAAYDLESKSVPTNLKELGDECYDDYEQFKTRILLIFNKHFQGDKQTKILIFRQKSGFSKEYSKQEFQVSDLHQVAPLVRDYLAGNPLQAVPIESSTREILVCTHGSHDKCCAKDGIPFYRQALTTLSELSLQNVRIWQASHIGGHRFAPTAIDFPEGRYYGYLDSVSFSSILTRTGDIQCLNQVYRGWGILPWAAQILEKKLLLIHGWRWFDYKVTAQIIEQNEEETFNRVELSLETPEGHQETYQADVVADESQGAYLKSSCSSETEMLVIPYTVKNYARFK